MRAWWVLALMLLAWPAIAQEGGDLGDDASGDVASEEGLPVVTTVDEMDLRTFGIVEDAQKFDFIIGVTNVDDVHQDGLLVTAFEVEFKHNGDGFKAYATRNNLVGTGAWFGTIQKFDPGRGLYDAVSTVDITPDYDEDSITIHVPREHLRDSNGTVPSPGRVLEAFHVTSYGNRIFGAPIALGATEVQEPRYTDHLPDQGTLDAVHEVQFGTGSTGHLHLLSDEPFRASNGEATTFVFDVTARNTGSETDRVTFDASGHPSLWEVTVPAGLDLPPGRDVQIPVVVRTAFAHAHGSTESLVLSMRGQLDDGTVGRIELGVYYPAIPQPAGHHDTLWFHSFDHSDPTSVVLGTALGAAFSQTGVFQDMYMNAVELDDRADETAQDARKCEIIALDPDYPVGTGYCWTLPLNPGLVMGLDFDLNREGTFTTTIETDIPLPALSVEAELVHRVPPPGWDGQTFVPFFDYIETVLGTVARTDAADVLSGSQEFTGAFIPAPEADLIPYDRYASLELRIQANTLRPDTWIHGPPLPPPRMVAGGTLQLPLLEYADPVTDISGLDESVLELDAMTDMERAVNPDRTVLFQARLTNHGNATDIGLEVIGKHREWAELLAPDTIHVDQHGDQTVAIAVHPPKGTADGESADLVLQAFSYSDATARTLIRFVATVDTTTDIPDESGSTDALRIAPDKQSPGPAPALALLAALAVARRLR